MKLECNAITDYIALVRSKKMAVCNEQRLLCKYVEKCFRTEQLRIDEAQLAQYLGKQKYFPFRLLEWEVFCFALHNCVYGPDEELRWPLLFIYVGRGAGKNGYEAFEDFCLLTPTNGVKEYHIDIFATSENQARTSFDDVYNVLQDNRLTLARYFTWNKEVITNKRTKSQLHFRTSGNRAYKTKDSYRPGKITLDEIHAYENWKLIEVATTGLGKKRHPRRTILSTDGDVRDGPLDEYLSQAIQILKGGIPDNGMLPFICRIDKDSEVHNPAMWEKANPSLPHFPSLRKEMQMEYADYKRSPVTNAAFMTKRMNRPRGQQDAVVTSWDNIMAASRAVPDVTGMPCVAGIDYASTRDFVAAGLLFLRGGVYYWLTHTWVCKTSPDLERIRAPLDQWEQKQMLTLVNGPEVMPEVPAQWLAEQAKRYDVRGLGIDLYRHTLLARALNEAGFDTDKEGANNVKRVRKSDQMFYAPIIESMFDNHNLAWGENNELMRWYTNNACVITLKDGNKTYGKIEPKSRKTDGFMALVAAICTSGELEDCAAGGEAPHYGVFVC